MEQENSQPDRKRHKSSMSNKAMANHNARILAIQCLSALDTQEDQNLEMIIYDALQDWGEFLPHVKDISEINQKYFIFICKNAWTKKNAIREKISAHLNADWTLERLGTVVRAILYAGTFEVLYSQDVPKNTIISDYLNIAKEFDHAGEAKFINAILDKITA